MKPIKTSDSADTEGRDKVQVVIREVGPEDADQRLDNFLLRYLKGVPKTRIYRIIRRGEVRVNGARSKPAYRLTAGDKVRIPPVRVAERQQLPSATQQQAQQLLAQIIFQDERFLLLNKPAGWAVHGGSGIQLGVVETLRQVIAHGQELELAHRLDRETSGCLLLAKKRSALRMLQQQLREQAWNKEYLALLKGKWEGGSRKVDAPLVKNTLRSGERVVTVSDDGKPAQSEFIPLAVGEQWSLVLVKLLTGRTHQIRVHSAHIGHPVAGDQRYGDKAFNQWCRDHGLRRMFLHAYKVRVKLPELDREIKHSAALDEELKQFLRQIGCQREF